MKSKYDYEIIRDYLHGLVDQETAQRIRDLIRTDEVARNIAAGILQLEHEFNGDEHEMEAYIEGLRQKQLKLISEDGRQGTTSFGWIKLAAAILIIAMVGAAVWLTMVKSNNNDLLAHELNQPYSISVERGESNADAGFELYMRGDYKNAMIAFDKVTNDVSATFYNGLSHLYSGDYDRAVTLLSSETLGASRYNEQAEWYYSLALIKAGRNDEARDILEKIGSETGHYKSDVARELLRRNIE